MPETCGCHVNSNRGYISVSGKIVQCNLHARAAQMRELLALYVEAVATLDRRVGLGAGVKDVLAKTRALLEATR